MRRLFKTVMIGVIALSAGVLAATETGRQTAKPLANPVEATPESIAAGEASYQKYCRSCHGDAGKGDGKMAPTGSTPADLTDAVWDHGSTDGDIFRVISNGAPPPSAMKGFKSRMTPREIWNIVNHLRSLQSTADSK